MGPADEKWDERSSTEKDQWRGDKTQPGKEKKNKPGKWTLINFKQWSPGFWNVCPFKPY